MVLRSFRPALVGAIINQRHLISNGKSAEQKANKVIEELRQYLSTLE